MCVISCVRSFEILGSVEIFLDQIWKCFCHQFFQYICFPYLSLLLLWFLLHVLGFLDADSQVPELFVHSFKVIFLSTSFCCIFKVISFFFCNVKFIDNPIQWLFFLSNIGFCIPKVHSNLFFFISLTLFSHVHVFLHIFEHYINNCSIICYFQHFCNFWMFLLLISWLEISFAFFLLYLVKENLLALDIVDHALLSV